MLPDSVLFFLFGIPRAKTLTFSPNAQAITESGAVISAPYTLLAKTGTPPINTLTNPVIVDVILPQTACLIRDIALPKMSRKNLLQAIALDTQRTTPFQSDEIIWTYIPVEKGKIRQFIFRQADAIELQMRLENSDLIVKQLMVEKCADPPLFDFSSKLTDPYGFWRKVNFALTAILVGIIAASVWQPIATDRRALEHVNQEITELRKTALASRTELTEINGAQEEKAAFLQILSKQYFLADLLRELTVRLPDSVWISSIQYNGTEVIISGSVKGSAAELVLVVAQSNILVNPRLSGPVSRGQIPDTENFEIAATIRQGAL